MSRPTPRMLRFSSTGTADVHHNDHKDGNWNYYYYFAAIFLKSLFSKKKNNKILKPKK